MTDSNVPFPNTSLTALVKATYDVVYYQAEDFSVWGIRFEHDTEQEPVARSPDERGMELGTLAPMSVVDVDRPLPQLYFLDDDAILRKGTLNPGTPGIQDIDPIDWLQVQADDTSKVSSDAKTGKGTWVYYMSNNRKAIREMWTQPPPIEGLEQSPGYPPVDFLSRQLKYTTFAADDILMGTGLASNVLDGQDDGRPLGTFYFQREDGSLWRNFWDGQWIENKVVPGPMESSTTGAAFHTGLAATVVDDPVQTEYLFYVNSFNELYFVKIRFVGSDVTVSNPEHVETPEVNEKPLAATSLAATARKDDNGSWRVRVYYQTIFGVIYYQQISG